MKNFERFSKTPLRDEEDDLSCKIEVDVEASNNEEAVDSLRVLTVFPPEYFVSCPFWWSSLRFLSTLRPTSVPCAILLLDIEWTKFDERVEVVEVCDETISSPDSFEVF